MLHGDPRTLVHGDGLVFVSAAFEPQTVKVVSRPGVVPLSMTTTPTTTSTTTPTTTPTLPMAPPLPKATLAASTSTSPTAKATNPATLRTWSKLAYATPKTQPLPQAVTTHATALAAKLTPLLQNDVESHLYDTSPFASALAQHLEGKGPGELVAAFQSFAPRALDAWNDGGSSCVGHCLSLVARLRAQGLPAALVPVEHPPGARGAHEPPFAHVAVAIPIVDVAGGAGVIICDTGNNVSAPAVLFPGQPVTVPLGSSGRSFTYALSDDGQSVSCARPLSTGTEVTTLHLTELLNPDATLTAPYASMNPLVTLCARDPAGGVRASVVVDLEQAVVRLSMGAHKTKLSFTDDVDGALSDVFAAAFGMAGATLRARIGALIDAAPTMNALRTALEGGAS